MEFPRPSGKPEHYARKNIIIESKGTSSSLYTYGIQAKYAFPQPITRESNSGMLLIAKISAHRARRTHTRPVIEMIPILMWFALIWGCRIASSPTKS